MDFTSSKGRAILRQIQFQIARRYPTALRAPDELSAEITVRAAKAGLPVYLTKGQ